MQLQMLKLSRPLQILSLTLFENTLLAVLITRMESRSDTAYTHNQWNLFDNFAGQ